MEPPPGTSQGGPPGSAPGEGPKKVTGRAIGFAATDTARAAAGSSSTTGCEHMGTTPIATSDLPTELLARGAAAPGARPTAEEPAVRPAVREDGDMRSKDHQFPTLPEAPGSPMSSNVLKARVRAA